MKKLILVLLAAIAPAGNAGDDALPNTQRIYTQLEITVSSSGLLGKSTATHTNLLTGSFCIIEIGGKPHIVTAAHNVALGPRGTPRTIGGLEIGRANQIVNMHRRTVLGSLAFPPSGVATFSPDEDVLLLQAAQDIFKASKTLKVAKRPPAVGDVVTICGYPGTSHEKTTKSSVAAAYPKHIVLNNPVEHGYSGGVVLDSDGKVVAIVTGTEEKHATAIRLSRDQATNLQWRPWQ